MSATFLLDRAARVLYDVDGHAFDPASRTWQAAASHAHGEPVDAIAAATWLQRESGAPAREPIGVIGPREANASQLAAAEAVGAGLARIGFCVVCGGREGVMEAVARGVRHAGGLSIGLLPDATPDLANPFLSVVLATGIGEARNALIASAALCLVAIGGSHGTLSEVAFGLRFGKPVIGLEGAARVDGVLHVRNVDDALAQVARAALAVDRRSR
jgi:hypothetical protein